MTDQDNNKDKELKEGAGQEKKDDVQIPSSVNDLLQARQKLEEEQAKLDRMMKDKFTRNITVMFTDIKGSTSYFETYGDVEGRAMVQRHNSMLFPKVEEFGGKIIKTIGDAIMATFDDAAQGVRCAKAMQEVLKAHNKEQDQKHKRILVRIGLNFGPAVVEESDVFGDAVNLAARVEAKADAEQILISEDLYKEVRSADDVLVRFFGEVEAKGKAEPVKLYNVIWSDEQMVAESEFKKAKTRREVDKRGFTVKGRVLELITSRDGKQMKVSVLERNRGEERTVSQYDVVKVDDKLIKKQVDEVTTLLNRANKRGKITKEILKQLQSAGQILFDHLLTAEAKEKIMSTQAEHLLIRMDDQLVHVPWELLFDGKNFFCQRFSMGRIVATRQRVGDVQQRSIAKPLRMLVLADPRSDLPASKAEGAHIRDELDKEHEFISVNLKASEIPVNYVKSKMRDYDIIHYAGHADYDSENPANSGWLLADGKVSSGEIKNMTGNKPMPALVFANSCQSGMTDEWKIDSQYSNDIFGLANAFLVAGVQHYIGTFWDILDEPGQEFAMSFYHEMIGGASVGEAVRRARMRLIDKYGEETIVWASYMVYGDPSFSYLADVAEAEESAAVQAPAPPPQAQMPGYPQQPAVFRGADSAAMAAPKPAGISKGLIGGIVAALVLAIVIGLGIMKYTGGEVVIPEDAIAAGYMKLDKGDIDGAIKEFSKLAENSATKAEGLAGLASANLQKNDVVSAEQNAKEALAADPNNIKAHLVLGKIAYNKGSYQAAIGEFQAATKGTGKAKHKDEAFAMLAKAYSGMGMAAHQSGNEDQAVTYYQDAVKADPKDSDAAVNLGQLYLSMGKPAEAKQTFEGALSANPGNDAANMLLAQAVGLMAAQQDAAKQAEVNELAKDLAERWRTGKIPAPKMASDEWTSRPVTITFLDFEKKGRMTMVGEEDFIMIALTQALRDTGRVEVVEREKIDRILSELNLASSELANEDTRLRLGRLFGARLIATGSYIKFGDEAQVNLRLIETETSIAKVAVAEVMKGKSPSDIAKEVAKILVEKIKETYPVQGKITEVKGDTVKINVGTKVGVTEGMKMALLDEDQIKVGTIEILGAGPDVSKAKVIEGPGKISVGAKVKEITE